MNKLIKIYKSLEELKQIGLTIEFGNIVLRTTKQKLYKDDNGYFIKKRNCVKGV